MKKRFIICVDDKHIRQDFAIYKFFQNNPNLGFCYCFNNIWLITDPQRLLTVSKLRDIIAELIPEPISILVMEIQGSSPISAFCPESMREWIEQTWAKD